MTDISESLVSSTWHLLTANCFMVTCLVQRLATNIQIQSELCQSYEITLCLQLQQITTHTHTRLMAICPGLPRWAGTRKVKPIWILLKQETVSGTGISWAICKSASRSRQTTMPAPNHSVFYRPDALPATQPTASKHWRQFTTNYHIVWNNNALPSVLWHRWFRIRKSIWPVKIEWWGVGGVVICLEWGADCLHMVQLMPLPSPNPIVSCLI